MAGFALTTAFPLIRAASSDSRAINSSASRKTPADRRLQRAELQWHRRQRLPKRLRHEPVAEIFIDNIFGYSDNLTWQKGRHLLKFGGEFLRYEQNSFYPGNDGELGAFDYTGAYSVNPYAANSTLYPFADFLLDRVQDVQIGAVTGRTGQRQWRDGIFAQDDYKIRQNLTINLGLRSKSINPSTKSTTRWLTSTCRPCRRVRRRRRQ